MSVRTDRSQDLRDRYGRLLAFLDARGDLPAFAAGEGYDPGALQVLSGNSTAYRYNGKRFAQYSTYADAQREASSAPRGVWQNCGGDFHLAQ